MARIQSLVALIPLIERPYTKILQSVTSDGCSLNMREWHQCETVHCLGGWVVVHAGEAGHKLEELFRTEIAARLILKKSRPDAPLPNFYASNEAAMAFIKARAAEEVVAAV